MGDLNNSFHQELTKEYFEAIKKLNQEGTERSRARIMELEIEHKSLKEKMKNISEWTETHEAENDYNFKNIKFGNKLISEKVVPKQNEKINMLIDFNHETVKYTSEANKAAQKAIESLATSKKETEKFMEETRKDNKKFIRGILIGVFMLLLASIVNTIPQFLKLNQDHGNQSELMESLGVLTEELKKMGDDK